MQKTMLAFLGAALAFSLMISGCASGGNDPAADSSEIISEENISSGTYIIPNADAMLKLVPSEKTAVVILEGYYTSNDGGGGVFYYDAASQAEPDNGKVFEGEASGRFIRSCESDAVNVKWYGAKGDGQNDDTDAIQAAVDSLPDGGGTVNLPGGIYRITKTINIGNGDAGEKVSSKGGIRFIGSGGGFAFDSQASTTITAGSDIEAVLSVNGRISDVEISGVYLDGNGKAKCSLFLHSFAGSYFHNIFCYGFTEVGINILAGGSPTGNYNINNRFDTVGVYCAYDDTTALKIDGVYSQSNDTWLTTFTDCRFDTMQTGGSIAAHFKFVDSISFYRCHFNCYSKSSVGAVFDAMDNASFPCGMGFYDCSVSSTQVIEDSTHQIRPQYFYGFGTEDGEEIPSCSKLRGITDHGMFFNIDDADGFYLQREEDDRKDDGQGSGEYRLIARGGRTYTYDYRSNSADDMTHYNLKENNTLAVLVNAKNTLTGLSLYSSSYGDDTGSITAAVYRWDTDYATTLRGKALSADTIQDFPDNSMQDFAFSGLDSGYYLIVITGTSPEGDYGVACWTKSGTPDAITFINGEKSEDRGLWAEFVTE